MTGSSRQLGRADMGSEEARRSIIFPIGSVGGCDDAEVRDVLNFAPENLR